MFLKNILAIRKWITQAVIAGALLVDVSVSCNMRKEKER